MQMTKTTTTPEFINVPAFASAVADYLKDTLNQPRIRRRILTLEEEDYRGLGKAFVATDRSVLNRSVRSSLNYYN
jgi:hypothetical protein